MARSRRSGGYGDMAPAVRRKAEREDAELGARVVAARNQENGAGGRNRAPTVTGRARAAQNKPEQ